MIAYAILVVLLVVLALGFHHYGSYGGGWIGLLVVVVALLYLTHWIRPAPA